MENTLKSLFFVITIMVLIFRDHAWANAIGTIMVLLGIIAIGILLVSSIVRFTRQS